MKFIHHNSVKIEALVQAGIHGRNRNESRLRPLDEETVNAFHRFILQSPAHAWLRNRVQTSICLTSSSGAEAISDAIIKQKSPQYDVDESTPLQPYRLEIHAGWNLNTFVQGQKPRGNRNIEESSLISVEHIQQTITYTGSAANAQVLRCETYLEQTWSRTGNIVLQLIKLSAQSPSEEVHCGAESLGYLSAIQGISFNARTERLTVSVLGELHACVEICEIVAWIMSALRSSPTEPGVCACRPSVSIAPRTEDEPSSKLTKLSVNINFELSLLDGFPPGGCWKHMFNCPVIVADYPIRQRTKVDTGLEIPLAVLCAIYGTQRWTMLNDMLCIHAFSAMFIPVERINDTIFWHYVYDEAAGHVEFNQPTIKHLTGMRPEDLQLYRCIVRYCSEVKSLKKRKETFSGKWKRRVQSLAIWRQIKDVY